MLESRNIMLESQNTLLESQNTLLESQNTLLESQDMLPNPQELASPPHVFHIPAGIPFLEGIAAGLQKCVKEDPLDMARVTIYLPYNRAVRALREIFLKQNRGKSFFLPQIESLGEIDPEEEIPDFSLCGDSLSRLPIIPPVLRQGLLTTLVRQKQETLARKEGKEAPPLGVTIQLARELMRLLDQAAIEQVPLENLASLAPEHLASHWQITLDFLQIISHNWPLLLAEKGYQDPYLAHHHAIEDMLNRFAKNPPSSWIIAAGSTGTMPATARFLKAIANLPKGMLILPGLDTTLSHEEQEDLSPTHPQYALGSLLKRLNLRPKDIPKWPLLPAFPEKTEKIARARCAWLAQAYRVAPAPSSFDKTALEGLAFLACASAQEESASIALILRHALETPGQTAALITPDRRLARRVLGELERFGLIPKDTAGIPLRETSRGIFLQLITRAVLEDYATTSLLALLKHPLILGGSRAFLIEKSVSDLEKNALRGIRPGPGIAGLYEALPPTLKRLNILKKGLDFLDTSLSPFKRLLKAPRVMFEDLLQAHLQGAERLCGGARTLWAEDTGEALELFFQKLIEGASSFPPLKGSDYFDVLETFLAASTCYAQENIHPRLFILGVLEARLIHADVMILGGLNEGGWPPDLPADPWLSRPMRKDLGLPSLERRIGLSSHDFSQAFSHQKVYLTRSLRMDGMPTVPSRILMRLETILKAAGIEIPQETQWISWTRQLDQPKSVEPCAPPAPRPPFSTRPRRLSVTQVETWKRDPYALYARHILNLKPLEPLDADPDLAKQGTLIHQILDAFLRRCPDVFQDDAFSLLLQTGEVAFRPLLNRPTVRALWWPHFEKMARWFLDTERDRRKTLPPYKVFTEVQGKISYAAPKGPFQLTARADRLDVFEDGSVNLIDYKTGTLPKEQDVILGFSPQLPLEALIVEQKGFSGFAANHIQEMSFWRLCGGQKGGEIKTFNFSTSTLIQKTWEGFQQLVQAFDQEETPYLCQPLPDKPLTYNDYTHLARLLEWKQGGDDADE